MARHFYGRHLEKLGYSIFPTSAHAVRDCNFLLASLYCRLIKAVWPLWHNNKKLWPFWNSLFVLSKILSLLWQILYDFGHIWKYSADNSESGHTGIKVTHFVVRQILFFRHRVKRNFVLLSCHALAHALHITKPSAKLAWTSTMNFWLVAVPPIFHIQPIRVNMLYYSPSLTHTQ